MCQEWDPGEQEEVVERDQPEVVIAGQAGPGFPGLAGFCHAQHGFLGGGDLLRSEERRVGKECLE